MEIQYDTRSDMLYIGLGTNPSMESEEVSPGIVLDYDRDNRWEQIRRLISTVGAWFRWRGRKHATENMTPDCEIIETA